LNTSPFPGGFLSVYPCANLRACRLLGWKVLLGSFSFTIVPPDVIGSAFGSGGAGAGATSGVGGGAGVGSGSGRKSLP